MVGIQTMSASFSVLSGIIGLTLLLLSLRAFRANRDPTMAFLTGAFTLFSLKSFFVAYSVGTGAVGHEVLELIDAVGDLGTILLMVAPTFLARE